jgi:hypothetical protein
VSENFERIAVYDTEVAARMAQSLLEASGFHPRLLSDNVGGMLPIGDGVTLIVPAAEAEEARTILAESSEPLPDMGDEPDLDG